MHKYIAMIRGIGPGNPNMTREKFTACFEELGFRNIQVVLASGNVIFESSETDTNTLSERIENALPQKLGFSRCVIVRSQTQLQHLMDADPFENIGQSHNKGMYLLITFFRQAPNVPFALPYTPESKPFTLLGRIDDALYGSIDLSKGKTPDFMAWLERQFGKDITSRTPKTIRLILSRMNKI